MKKLMFAMAMISAMLIPSSCENSSEELTVSPVPDGEALNQKFIEGRADRTQQFTLDAGTGGERTSESGTILQFYANSFKDQSGAVVTGEVTIEFIEIYGRTDMLFAKLPTNGKMNDGSIHTLVSGGQFYVNAKKGSEQLVLAQGYSIIVPVSNSGGEDEDMRMFDGVEECFGDECDVVWEEADRGLEVGKWQTTGGVFTAYYTFQNKFGWTNIDKWFNDPRPKTTIFVDLPEGYDDSNCAIYLSYDGEPRALAQFDRYDEATGLFTEHYGLIPVGLKVHFIVVSIVEDQWHYAIAAATIGEDHVQVMEDLGPTTEAGLEELIDALP